MQHCNRRVLYAALAWCVWCAHFDGDALAFLNAGLQNMQNRRIALAVADWWQMFKNPKMLLKMPKTRYIYLNKCKKLNYNFL